MTSITVPSDKKDALICADQLYQQAVAAAATAKALAPATGAPGRQKKKTGETSGTHSGKRTSSECSAPVEDVPGSSTSGKKRRAIPLGTKKVSVNEDGTGGAFTISSTLATQTHRHSPAGR